MELFLLIGKIILIAFLAVAGLTVLAFGVVFLIPVRYEISGNIGDWPDIRIKGKVSYLLSIFKILFSYEEEQFDIKFYLFGLERRKQKENAEEVADELTEAVEATEAVEESEEEAEISFHTAQKTGETGTESAEEECKENKSKKAKVRKQEAAQKKKNKRKIDFTFIKKQITDEHNKSVVHKIYTELRYLLRHFKFRRIVTDLQFATGDPAATGQVFGVMCMIPLLYRYDFKIVPDFEAEELYVKGTFCVMGKVRLIHLLAAGLRLFFDKEVRMVIRRIRSRALVE